MEASKELDYCLPIPPSIRSAGSRPYSLPKHRAHAFTFIDVIFSTKQLKESLFHGLMYAMQLEALGLERYVKLSVRGVLITSLQIWCDGKFTLLR